MNLREIHALVQIRPPELRAAQRRLARCHDIEDLRRAGQRLIPRPVFDYVDGAADEELSMAANVAAFRRWRFVPRAVAGVAAVDTRAEVLGAGRPAARAGADRVYPDDAPGRGTRRGRGGRTARAALHVVHDGDHVGGRPGR